MAGSSPAMTTRSWLRRFGLGFLRPDVGLRRVMLAIGLAVHRPTAAEVEIILARMADRPHADGPGEIEHVAARRRHLLDDTRHQPDPVHLADHGVLGHADPAADFRGCDPLFP